MEKREKEVTGQVRPGEGERESRGGGSGGGANPVTPGSVPAKPGASPPLPGGRERVAPVSPADNPLEQPEGGGPMHRRHV